MREEGTLLYLDGVSVSFDGFRALNELSFVLDSGEMRAVIGPNGAGKTTMMDVITGKTRPDRGTVIFGESTDLTRIDEPAIAALGIGRKFQKPTVFEPHSVRDNLLLALKGDRSPRFSLFARETAAERARIAEILAITGLAALRDSPAAALSHGQKQWLEIGMLLAARQIAAAPVHYGLKDGEEGEDLVRYPTFSPGKHAKASLEVLLHGQ